MLNLENLKKQAKALVRLHKEGSYHLACVARETLPRFADRTDREILGGPFKLSDAQEILARRYGCETWTALMARAQAGWDPEAPAAAGPDTAVPMLYVEDVQRSVTYYVERLGFEVCQLSGVPPFFAEVARGGAALALRKVRGPVIDPEVRAREKAFVQATIRVADAKAAYLGFLTAGATFHAPLQRDAWGPPAFIVEDPDGNLVAFGQYGPDALARLRRVADDAEAG